MTANQARAPILIVDDEEKLRRYLKLELERRGHPARTAGDIKSAMDILSKERVDVALLDIYLSGEDGIEALKEIRARHPRVQVIMLTGMASVESAIESMKLGARDYLTKPYNFQELCLRVDKAAEAAALARENDAFRARISGLDPESELVAEDPAMKDLLELAARAASTDSCVLITGESGTGKEALARLIQRRSRRADAPYLCLKCPGAAPETFAETLFGVADSSAPRPGLLDHADGGTILLDEIASLAPDSQALLLGYLDTGAFRRKGGALPMRTDVRIVSTTRRDLPGMIRSGEFRDDLYYRLNVLTLAVPPLRDRRRDIPRLVEVFLKRLCPPGNRPPSVSPGALEALAAYSWPGNVRELENVVERALILGDKAVLGPRVVDSCLNLSSPASPVTVDSSLAEVERRHILKVLGETGGNKVRAAAVLKVDVKTLYNKLKSYRERA